MEQTLEPGDRVLVSRLAYAAAGPETGDVIVFDKPSEWDSAPPPAPNVFRVVVGWFGDLVGIGPSNARALTKRVIASPGQTAACCDAGGSVTVDDVPLDEPYLSSDFPFQPGDLDCETTPRSSRCFGPVVVPDGQYLVMGDNRSVSHDSLTLCRTGLPDQADCARFVPRDHIVGAVWAVAWPVGRWGPPGAPAPRSG